ncbi:Zinc finger protein ZFAT, partial [Ophiophagus hannah]
MFGDFGLKPVWLLLIAHSLCKLFEESANHTVMIQETLQPASMELGEQHHLVVSSDDMEGIGTVTVYTQGGEASELIVYVQEALQPMEVQEQSEQDI